MNISDVAKITGLTSKAIRFYEEKGLVTPPMRSENGYRTYTQQHLNELTLLRQARQVGFNLEESGELDKLSADPLENLDGAGPAAPAASPPPVTSSSVALPPAAPPVDSTWSDRIRSRT